MKANPSATIKATQRRASLRPLAMMRSVRQSPRLGFGQLSFLLPKRLLSNVLLPVLLLLTVPAHALESLFGSSAEPLQVEEAFAPELLSSSANDITVRFNVADEYFLYQKKFNFELDDPSVELQTPSYPPSIVQEDEFFGKSHVHRGQTDVTIPVAHTGEAKSLELTVGYQGCADMGLCYPPTKVQFNVDLPANNNSTNIAVAQADAAQSDIAPAKTSINDLLKPKLDFGGEEAPLLSPDVAFVPSILKAADGEIELRWFIEPGYYLYRDKINFTLADTNGAEVASFDVDRGIMENDAYFGNVEILREVAGARIKLAQAQSLTTATLNIHSQGCADIGVCFPPQTTSLPISFTNSASNAIGAIAKAGAGDTGGGMSAIADTSSAQANSNISAVTTVSNASGNSTTANTTPVSANTSSSGTTVSNVVEKPVSEQDKLTQLLEAGNLGFIALAFYGAGLLLAFTACMYPMIPILSSLIAGQGTKLSTTKAFGLSAVYVLSMASVFAVVGVLVGLSGFNIQPLFQNPWVLSAFAALFVLLALSMFGVFQLQMPSAIQTKVSELSNKQSGGTWSGVALMGMLSALIVGPCVTPPLVAALAYIANTGDAAIGGIALFAIGIGMGTPLLLIGTSLGRFLPKAGGWMDTTQRVFGIILLIVAIYMLSRFLPGNVIMLMFAVLAIFTGVYFGATDRLDNTSRGIHRFGKSVGLVSLVYGFVLMVGALAGGTSMLSPLQSLVGNSGGNGVNGNAVAEHLTFQRVKNEAELDSVLANAKAQGRPVMFDFYADWCISCKEMEAFTFTDPRVQEQLRDAVLIQADVTENNDDDKALLKRFSLFGPPAIMLYDRSGTELTAGRVVGFMKADKFNTHLQAYLN